MSAVSFIEKVARRLLIQNQPKGIITIPNRMTTEAKAGEIAATFQRAGLSMDRFDEFITSEADVVRLLNQIAAFEKKNLADNIRSGIRNTESAKVFDLKGKEIPRGSKIMGGKEVKGTSDRDRVRNEMKEKYGFTDERLDEIEKTPIDEEMADRLIAETDLPPPGSRGGPDDIAAPVQSAEESLRDMIMAENKKNIAKMRQRKMLEEAIDDASPGFSGDRKVDAELVAENLAERMGMVYDDLPTKERIKLYDEALTGLSKKKPDPEDFAKGGIARIGLKDGMNRRTFMKIFTGLVSLPIIGKVLKPLKVGKTVSKVPIIKTDNVPGKPEWFDQLVNKVILEGDDVTKRFATKEREIVHTKDLGDGTTVRVTQDMDEGAVRVEYDSLDNVFEDTVQMQYKKPLPDEGDPRPTAEFTTAESGPVGRQSGPDDYDIDVDEVGGTSISDLDSDVSKLKEYATGQKPTMKELVQNIKRKDKANRITTDTEAQSDAIIRRQGEMLDYDPEPDFASGGLAGMLGE